MENGEIDKNIKLLTGQVEPAVEFIGMKLETLQPGYARVSMVIKPEHRNVHGMAFGGIIMALADHAFGYGANSLSYPSVASQFNMHFLRGAQTGETLVAESRVIKSGKRISVSEIKVTNSRGDLIAMATGTTVPVASAKGVTGRRDSGVIK
ncbi:MAG: PaaI family thioesterase [Dehalococcoidales bacterium]|jgi:acyl-CoA thioesterase|nr:PaaI family thioesterase [Dehalococcoidales bacterium]